MLLAEQIALSGGCVAGLSLEPNANILAWARGREETGRDVPFAVHARPQVEDTVALIAAISWLMQEIRRSRSWIVANPSGEGFTSTKFLPVSSSYRRMRWSGLVESEKIGCAIEAAQMAQMGADGRKCVMYTGPTLGRFQLIGQGCQWKRKLTAPDLR